jgi:hypothetical protein
LEEVEGVEEVERVEGVQAYSQDFSPALLSLNL